MESKALALDSNISDKFSIDLYFALGVKSCWLVIPANEVITVYSAQGDFESFGSKDTEVIDDILDIRLPKPQIFGR
ncbi:MAG: hypothetical protein VSS75_018325 [Candidatus Parabeggiatoa sp.]|nr:hypothetical protein [Candidatus Parabeggiatoa sp.]